MKDAENQKLVWMDLEMTGLEPDSDTILEVATVITDKNLNVIAEGPVLAIHHSEETLQGMDDWNRSHHSDSGLWKRAVDSKIDCAKAEKQTLDFIKQHVGKRESPLCGNSIGQDRRFLYKYMPELSEHLHYRNIDVSTIKELRRLWYAETPEFEKKGAHLALDDIYESIEELKYYQKELFK